MNSQTQKPFLLKSDLIQAFRSVGLRLGQAVMVHTSLSSLGFVCGGPQTIIEALLECTGPDGTIMMPSQSWKNLDPEAGVHGDVPEEFWPLIRENWPAYDPAITPSNTMGAVAEMFWKWPGALRSSHPARSVSALGKYAAYLTGHHDLSNIFGDGSPLGKLYELDGWVLLIGVGHNKNTSLHLADARAGYPGKHTTTEHSAILVDGKREWVAYETLYVDGEDFPQIGEAFEKQGGAARQKLGNGQICFMRQRELVDFAVKWIEENRK